ncbi:MAG: DUF805 domain-containing protein [Bacteroidetes bacterium]|jgi:uncharacterized membrane protein YhaH (DUF805 family)|nr:DUF805 domain-containing protein [Bacteroidota bacterium]
MNYYLLALKSYGIFSGRSRRAEYWYFVLIHFIILVFANILDLALFGNSAEVGAGYITLTYAFLTLLPQLALGFRRLHDIGKSGWWLLIAFTGIGAILLIWWLATDSEQGTNKFGANPKQIIV